MANIVLRQWIAAENEFNTHLELPVQLNKKGIIGCARKKGILFNKPDDRKLLVRLVKKTSLGDLNVDDVKPI